MKILLIHGVGHKEVNGTWDAEWQAAIRKVVGAIDPVVKCEFEKVLYDEQFAKAKLDAGVIAEALARLLASGVWHGIGDIFSSRGFGDDNGTKARLTFTSGIPTVEADTSGNGTYVVIP
jgi:hypothetical protein